MRADAVGLTEPNQLPVSLGMVLRLAGVEQRLTVKDSIPTNI